MKQEPFDCPKHGISRLSYCDKCLEERNKKDEAEKEAYKAMPKHMRL